MSFDVIGSFMRTSNPVAPMPDITFAGPFLVPRDPDMGRTGRSTDGFNDRRRWWLIDNDLPLHGDGLLHDHRAAFRTAGGRERAK